MLAAVRPEHLLGPDADSLQILGAWLNWLQASYSAATVQGYWGWVFRFLRHNPAPLVYVTEQQVAMWLETYSYRSQSRRDGHLALKSLFNWMEGHRLIVVNPVTGIRTPPVVEKETRALTESELKAVYDAAYLRAPYRAHAIALLYYTGGRLKEVVNLRWDDVKPDHLVLRVTKNGKERKQPRTAMLDEAMRGLAEAFPNSEVVIPRTGQTIWTWCRDAGRDAGVDHVHPHLFRSTFITDQLNSQVPPQVVQRNAGHGSLKVTTRYAHSTEDQKREAVEKLHRLGPDVP